ncbi:MAG TPA: hypothetical protein VFU31_11010 [Candidatus Binatia bacterium]|nr:hypothetical protein [Candidatus Binatia bacterium]
MFPNRVDTLERGDVYFFFRSNVVEEAPEKVEDAPTMSVVLSPEESNCYRLLVIVRKQTRDDKDWGFVDAVTNEPKNIENRLAPEAYPTKTRGETQVPALRPIAEGVYRIVRHNDHAHFVYALKLPKATGGAEAPFSLENQASYIISIKNPEKGSRFGNGLEESVDLPRHLQEIFRDRPFCEADPPDFLNYAGIEFVLISVAENEVTENLVEELGFDLQTHDESLTSAQIFHDLKMQESVHTSNPFFKPEPGKV